MKLKRLSAVLLAVMALAFMAGCGSGGSGTSLIPVTKSAPINVFVTDGFSDQYKQVLATIFKIELTTDGTTFSTVFADTAGRTLDLASLAATTELLASVTAPVGTYTQARITFGDHITLVDKSGISTSVAVDSSVGTAANGQVAITVSTPARVLENQANAVTVDFKLAEFQLIGGKIHPSISCDEGIKDHPGGKHTAHIDGTVSNLNGTTSFTLTGEHSRTTTINLTATTAITSGQTGAVVTLANGQNVIVVGAFDTATSSITATSVTVNDFTTADHTEANGTVASVDAAAKTFVLTVQRAEHIMPTGGTIIVATDTNTRFNKGGHSSGTLADIVAGAEVEVEGTFNTTTQTLTAKSVSLHNDSDH